MQSNTSFCKSGLLISAEGKNPDIIEALLRARSHSARSVNILTNRRNSSLIQAVTQLTDIRTHIFELTQKDGYLATNSLLMDAVLVARAYGELDSDTNLFPDDIEGLSLNGQSISAWLQEAEEFIQKASERGNIIVTYSPLLKSIATDLESKLGESALLHCQMADLRSFAHGRHLWLADRLSDCAILAITEPSLEGLWSHMLSTIPTEVPTLTMPAADTGPSNFIAGLVAQMHLVSFIGKLQGKDPGKPIVPQFGRELYYANLENFVQRPKESNDFGKRSKYETSEPDGHQNLHMVQWVGNLNHIRRKLKNRLFVQ